MRPRRGKARRPSRRSAVELQIERLIREGADPHDFLCVDCSLWVLEVHYCGCWERGLF